MIRIGITKIACIFSILYLSAIQLQADNPLVKDVGMADPHIRIFNKIAYLFTTRDAEKNAQSFIMPDWHIWSSNDLVNWKHETTIDPTETYMGKSNNCWATDAVTKNGKFYFYFSNANVNTGVMVSNTIVGPYKDALNEPLLKKELTPGKEYDPTILIDDDEKAFIVFGHYRKDDPNLNYYIAELNNDMISLAESPKVIEIQGNINVLGGNDKPTLHKKNGLYYLSAGSHYATATNVYGPYTRRGNSGNNKFGLSSRAHGNYFDWNNQSFHTWCHFHLGKEIGRYRESYLTYLHYKKNGEMVSDTTFLMKHFETGVGQYDATWEKIELEWYMESNHVEKTENQHAGFEISAIQNNGTLYFPNVHHLNKINTISFSISGIGQGTIKIYNNKEKDRLMGTVTVNSKSNDAYNEYACQLKNTTTAKNIFIEFNGTKFNKCKIDYLKFQ